MSRDAAWKPTSGSSRAIFDRLPAGHRKLLRRHFTDSGGNLCQYYLGTLKSFNHRNGYGFLECAAATADWGSDVFIHKDLVPSPWTLGQPIEFAVSLNPRGQPQATDVQWLRLLPDGPRPPAQATGQQPPAATAARGYGGLAAGDAPAASRLRGTLKSYAASQGYGFIACEEVAEKYKRDVYFDRNQLPQHGGWREGQALEFELVFNARGNPQARNVDWAPAAGNNGHVGGGADVSPETRERLQNLMLLIEQGKADDEICSVAKEEEPKINLVRMLLVLMMAKMFKRDVAPDRCKQLGTWFLKLVKCIDPASSDIKGRYPDVARQILEILAEARRLNPLLDADDLGVDVSAAEGVLRGSQAS